MDNLDQSPALPLTEDERKRYQAEADAGKIPDLSIVRRFIATIRRSITDSPKKTESAKKSRTKITPLSEDQVDFF